MRYLVALIASISALALFLRLPPMAETAAACHVSDCGPFVLKQLLLVVIVAPVLIAYALSRHHPTNT